MTDDEAVEHVRRYIDELSMLPDEWGGREKPTATAIGVAVRITESMARRHWAPLRAAPMADGGVGLCYSEGARRARFDVYNDGAIVVSTRAVADKNDHENLPLDEAVDIMCRFLSRFVSWPEDQPQRYNACSDPCDMWTGPCACGAWHKEGR